MRIALALVLATSCATPACPLSACAGVCPNATMAPELVLAPWQGQVLKEDLADLRAGLQFQGPASMCAIDSECREGAIPATEELNEDPVDLLVTYRTPKFGGDGDFRGMLSLWCAKVVPGAKESLERPETMEVNVLAPATYGEWKTWSFFRVPLYYSQIPLSCAWSMDLADPDGRTAHLAGRFLRKAFVDRTQLTTGLPANASTPGVTVIGAPTPTTP